MVLGRRPPIFQDLGTPLETFRVVAGDGVTEPVIRETTVLVTVVTFGIWELDPKAGPMRYGLGRILKSEV